MRLFLSAVRHFPRLVTTLALAAVTLATFTGCGPEEGTILGKQYLRDQSYWTTVADYSTVCTGSGTTRTCRSQWIGSHQQWNYVPDCWQLLIKTPEGKGASVCVDSSVWADADAGEYWKKS